MVLDAVRVGEDQPSGGLRRKTDGEIGIVRQQPAQCGLGLYALRPDQNETESAHNIPCFATDLDCETQSLQFRFSAQNGIGHGGWSRFFFHKAQQVLPAASGHKRSRYVQRRVTVMVSARKQPIRRACSWPCKFAFAFGAHECLEIFIRKADCPALQANARREVRADVGELRFGAFQNRSQVRQGNRSRQDDQGGTKPRHFGGDPAFGERLAKLLLENILERLPVRSQAIERGARMCPIHLECIVLHSGNAAGEMVEVVNPGTRRSSPHPSDILRGFLPAERLDFSGAIRRR